MLFNKTNLTDVEINGHIVRVDNWQNACFPKKRRPEGRRLRFEVCANQQNICRKANREVCLTNDRHHLVAQATRLLSLG